MPLSNCTCRQGVFTSPDVLGQHDAIAGHESAYELILLGDGYMAAELYKMGYEDGLTIVLKSRGEI